MCGNVAYIRLLEDWQKYSFRKCYKCDKEMPHSRFFHNIGVREKNAKTTMEPVVDKVAEAKEAKMGYDEEQRGIEKLERVRKTLEFNTQEELDEYAKKLPHNVEISKGNSEVIKATNYVLREYDKTFKDLSD